MVRGTSFQQARSASRMHLRKGSSRGMLTAFLLVVLFNSLAPGMPGIPTNRVLGKKFNAKKILHEAYLF
jgi:hypothetical protein